MFSLIGVVLIARPTFIFGVHSAVALPSTAAGDVDSFIGDVGPSESGTPAQRLGAVGSVLLLLL